MCSGARVHCFHHAPDLLCLFEPDQVVQYNPSTPGTQYQEQQNTYDMAASQIAILAGIMYTGANIHWQPQALAALGTNIMIILLVWP